MQQINKRFCGTVGASRVCGGGRNVVIPVYPWPITRSGGVTLLTPVFDTCLVNSPRAKELVCLSHSQLSSVKVRLCVCVRCHLSNPDKTALAPEEFSD